MTTVCFNKMYIGNVLLTGSGNNIISDNVIKYTTYSSDINTYDPNSLVPAGSVINAINNLKNLITGGTNTTNVTTNSNLALIKTAIPNSYKLTGNIDNKTFTILTANYVP